MSAENGRFYEFGDFRLDPAAKTLFCQNAPVALTPKVFDTLQFMVEHAGRLLEKDELMQNIWHGSVCRREQPHLQHQNAAAGVTGRRAPAPLYRDRAPARISLHCPGQTDFDAATVDDRKRRLCRSCRFRNDEISSIGRFRLLLILLAGAAAMGTWFWQRRTAASAHAPILSAAFKSRKLSSTGSVHALITPDGKYVAYTNESGGKQSIWLRQIETSENIQIVPPGDVSYLGLAISHDGNALYFVRRDRTDQVSAAIYRVMTFGGIPVKIADRVRGLDCGLA